MDSPASGNMTRRSNRPGDENAGRSTDRKERPASEEAAEKEAAEKEAGPPQSSVVEDSEALAAMKEAFRDGMVAGGAVVLGIVALRYWGGFSAAPSFLDALWPALPLAFAAMVVGGAIQCLRCALRLGREQPDGEAWGLSDALVGVGAVMAVLAWGFLKEAKEDGTDSLKFGAVAIVVIAAVVFLLLVFAPSVLEDLRRAVARSF